MRSTTIVTWNIRFGLRIDGALELLSTHPVLSSADVLLLQELDGEGASRLASRLGFDLHYEAACLHPQTGREFGNAIMSRTPLDQRQVVALPHVAVVGGTPRLAIAATTRLAGNSLRLWCTHAEIPAMRPDRRRRQFAAIADAVRRDPAPSTILAGDFNTVSRRGIATLASMVGEAGLHRVLPEAPATVRRGGRSFTLDHVFHRGVNPLDAGVVRADDVSDHSAVWFRFRA